MISLISPSSRNNITNRKMITISYLCRCCIVHLVEQEHSLADACVSAASEARVENAKVRCRHASHPFKHTNRNLTQSLHLKWKRKIMISILLRFLCNLLAYDIGKNKLLFEVLYLLLTLFKLQRAMHTITAELAIVFFIVELIL
jgi:hypothetical protein